MPFDGVTWPKISVLAGFGGSLDPGAGYLHLGVGPGLGTGMLGGAQYIDIRNDAVSIVNSRGRPSQIDIANPGTCTIVLDNTSGVYDPTNPASVYWGPNLLTANQSGIETDASGWTVGGNCTLTRSTVQFHSGAASLLLTASALGNMWANGSPSGTAGDPVSPGMAYQASAWFQAVSTGRNCRVSILWFNATGTNISQTDGAFVADTSGGWVQATVATQAPTLAAFAVLQVLVDSSPAAAEAHYADDMVLQQSAVEVGTPVQVLAEWPLGTIYGRFFGEIADISLDAGYSPTVTLTCSDGLEKLGRTQLTQTSTLSYDGDRTGQRIDHLASAANWPTSLRSLDTGYTFLGPTLLGATALELMHKTEQTEVGLLYVNGRGVLVFYDRYRATTATRSTTVQASFTDTQGASDVEMDALLVARSRDGVYNDIHIIRDPAPNDPTTPGAPADVPVEQVATDPNPPANFGLLNLPVTLGQLQRNDSESLAMAQYLLGRFKTPQVLIRSLTVKALTQGQWSVLLPLDLLDLVSVSRDYGPNTIPAQLLIQAVSEEIRFDETDTAWNFTFTTAARPPAAPQWILGTAALGVTALGW